MPFMRKALARRIVTSLAALAAALVLAEVGARIWLFHLASEKAFLDYASLTDLRGRKGDEFFVRHRYLGWVPTPSWERGKNRHNALGFRGEEFPVAKPAGEYRIACLGGSTTYTSSVEDWTQAYPAALERELHALGRTNVRVINAGLHGWTSWESLIDFELRVLDLDPDLVVVCDGYNDLKVRFVWPPEAYRGDNSGSVAAAPSLFVPPAWQSSALARIVAVDMGWMKPQRELDVTLDLGTSEGRWKAFRNQLLRGSYPSGFFREVSAAQILDANPPVYFERNLENLIRIAEREGVGVVLATAPYRSEALGGTNPGHEDVERGMAEMNASLRGIAERTGVPLYDFAAEMTVSPRTFDDDVHVTAEGAALQGRLFAEFLDRSVLR